MQTYKEMQDELIWRIQSAANSTRYPLTRIKLLITDAHQWATTLYIWDALVKARMCDSGVFEYYDYPDDFRDGTIIRLELNNEKYDRKNYEDYLDWQRNNPGDTKKIFASFGRQYFITPTPTAVGSSNISIWGAIQAPALVGDTDKTVFSMNNDTGNEAIVRKALAAACTKTNPNLATKEEQAATDLLEKLYEKQERTKNRDQRLEHPRFIVPDMFARRSRFTSPIHNFNR